MKNLFYILLAMPSLSCSQKNDEISPDSIYNVSYKWEKQDGKTITFSDM